MYAMATAAQQHLHNNDWAVTKNRKYYNNDIGIINKTRKLEIKWEHPKDEMKIEFELATKIKIIKTIT